MIQKPRLFLLVLCLLQPIADKIPWASTLSQGTMLQRNTESRSVLESGAEMAYSTSTPKLVTRSQPTCQLQRRLGNVVKPCTWQQSNGVQWAVSATPQTQRWKVHSLHTGPQPTHSCSRLRLTRLESIPAVSSVAFSLWNLTEILCLTKL